MAETTPDTAGTGAPISASNHDDKPVVCEVELTMNGWTYRCQKAPHDGPWHRWDWEDVPESRRGQTDLRTAEWRGYPSTGAFDINLRPDPQGRL
jgi:hypothetical protein